MAFVKCPFLATCVDSQTQTKFMDKGSTGTLTQLWKEGSMEGWRPRGPEGSAPFPLPRQLGGGSSRSPC